MKYKPRVKYWAVSGMCKGKPYIPKDYTTTRLHIYTDRKKALKECVGAEIVVPISFNKKTRGKRVSKI